ncbi:MAG: hypothetical protein CMM50_03760 [Rhodospirillaceae bacterium]|nr:hypothetical protein [Rhodospirillaceae bacterium]
MAKAVLTVWCDVVPEHEDAFNVWYNDEHIAERVAIPGIRSGQRYVAEIGNPKYLAWYEVDDVGVLTSPSYRQALDTPSAQTSAVMPHFRNMVRTACSVRAAAGDATQRAPWVATLRVSASEDKDEALGAWLAETALPHIAESAQILSAQLWRGDHAASATPGTAEAKMRGAPDRMIDWAVLIEAESAEAAGRVHDQHLSPDALLAHGASSGGEFGVYRLIKSLSET